MKWFRYTFCFCLLALSAEAKLQYTFVVDTVDQFGDQWTVKGGVGDQITVLNDGVDGQYIFSKSTADSIQYMQTGIASYDYEHLDIIDSVIVRLRVQDFQAGGTAQMRVGLAISTDISWAGAFEPNTQTWQAVAASTFLTPPGSRGTWDKWELDSTNVIFNPTTITNDSLGITACSVFVFTTLAVPYRMYFTKDTSNCTAGVAFSKAISKYKPVIIDTVKMVVPLLDVSTNYFFTKANYPSNDAWGTTGFVLRFKVIKSVGLDSLAITVSRTNSSCTVQESAPYKAFTTSGTGEKSFAIPPYTCANGSCSDLLRFQISGVNTGIVADTFWFEVGVNESRADMDFAFNVAGCPAEQGVACGGLEDTLRVQDTTINMQQWTNYNAYAFQKDTFQITAFQESYGTPRVAKITSLQDRIFGTAIFEQTATDTQRFILDNTNMGASPTISTMWGYAYARRKAATGTTTFRMRLMRDGQTFYCESGDLTLNGIYTLYTFQFTGVPTGAGSCAGALTVAALDSLNIAFVATAIAANDTVLVGMFDLYVCYTAGGVVAPKRRRRLIQLSGVPENVDGAREFAKVSYFNPDEIIGFREDRWLWSGE